MCAPAATPSGLASHGFDVKLATTSGALALDAPVMLGAGDLTLNRSEERRVGNDCSITAAGLRILGSGSVRLDSAANDVTTLAADHTGTISYADATDLTVGSVT